MNTFLFSWRGYCQYGFTLANLNTSAAFGYFHSNDFCLSVTAAATKRERKHMKFRLKESIVIVSSRGWREGKKTTFRPLGFLSSDLRKPSGRNVVFFPSLHPLLDTKKTHAPQKKRKKKKRTHQEKRETRKNYLLNTLIEKEKTLKVAPAQCAAQRTVVQKWRRSPGTSVRESRSFHAKTKSKPACLHKHGAGEKAGILNINSPIFLTPPQELVEQNKLTEKKVGVTGHFENLFFKKTRFPIAIHTKARMLFGQQFDGQVPRNLNHIFLGPFEHGFNKIFGTFMFKNQNDGATLSAAEQWVIELHVLLNMVMPFSQVGKPMPISLIYVKLSQLWEEKHLATSPQCRFTECFSCFSFFYSSSSTAAATPAVSACTKQSAAAAAANPMMIASLLLRSQRVNKSRLVLAGLATSLLLMYIFFMIGMGGMPGTPLCTFSAVAVHYTLLSAFCWMLVEAIVIYLGLHKALYVVSRDVKLIPACVFSWGWFSTSSSNTLARLSLTF